jgi:hypothetical protein
MALTETEVEVRAWLDRLAIQDLIYRYSDAVTRADWKQAAALFASHAVWEAPSMGLRCDGVAAIVEMLTETSKMEILVLSADAPVINLIAPDTAQATTTQHEWGRGIAAVDLVRDGVMNSRKGEEVRMDVYGVYYDDLGRIDGEWKFTHRLWVPIYVGTEAVTGAVLTPRSELLRQE